MAEDVETVGGLLAHQLGKVPIAGSQATVEGLQLTAENLTGHRNRIGTVRVQRVDRVGDGAHAAGTDGDAHTQADGESVGDHHRPDRKPAKATRPD